MELTEPMDWVEIDYAGELIRATNFLDGILVRIPGQEGSELVAWPGWYVQEQRGDMDGPALRKRKTKAKEFALVLREYKPN